VSGQQSVGTIHFLLRRRSERRMNFKEQTGTGEEHSRRTQQVMI
jgi:hypothetical protein